MDFKKINQYIKNNLCIKSCLYINIFINIGDNIFINIGDNIFINISDNIFINIGDSICIKSCLCKIYYH